MACNVEKVIEIALAEVGYLEKKNGDLKYLYDKTANAGDKNYTKYNYEMNKIYPAVMDYPAAWCDAFADWCFYKAYGIANAKALLGGDFNDYTVASAQLYKNKGAWHSTPKKGDQAFFKNSTRINHTELVTEVSGDTFYTVGGNTSGGTEVVANGGGVHEKSYKLSNNRIAGFGRPAYDKQAFKPHWVYSDGKWYYRIEEDKNAHGWRTIKNADGRSRWYSFDDKGAMRTGWQTISDNKYYLEESGDLEGALYRSDSSGAQSIWIVE